LFVCSAPTASQPRKCGERGLVDQRLVRLRQREEGVHQVEDVTGHRGVDPKIGDDEKSDLVADLPQPAGERPPRGWVALEAAELDDGDV
jgi:hypothetical protein